GLPCPPEGDEERVTLVVDLRPAVGCERLAEDAVVVGERLGVPFSQLFEQRRRTLDVREQEGRSGRGVLAHAAIIAHRRGSAKRGRATLAPAPGRRCALFANGECRGARYDVTAAFARALLLASTA